MRSIFAATVVILLLASPALAEDVELRVYEGSALASRWVPGEGWVRAPESDYDFTLVQRRTEGLWTSSKELRFVDETVVTTERLVFLFNIPGGQTLELRSSFGDGEGRSEADGQSTSLEVQGERGTWLRLVASYADDKLNSTVLVHRKADEGEVPYRLYVEEAQLQPEPSASPGQLLVRLRPADPPQSVAGLVAELCGLRFAEQPGDLLRREDRPPCVQLPTSPAGEVSFTALADGTPLRADSRYLLRLHLPSLVSASIEFILAVEPWVLPLDVRAPAPLHTPFPRTLGLPAIGGPGEAKSDARHRDPSTRTAPPSRTTPPAKNRRR